MNGLNPDISPSKPLAWLSGWPDISDSPVCSFTPEDVGLALRHLHHLLLLRTKCPINSRCLGFIGTRPAVAQVHPASLRRDNRV
jgi:hypothetical protein